MSKLTPVFLDFESFWDVGHSLTKMSPIKYVMHPDTEIISVAAKVSKYPTDVIFGEDTVRKSLQAIDWSDKFVIAHNMSGFDSMICAWRMGIRPAMWGCTLAMAAPHHANTTGLSLAKLVEHYADELRAMGISPVKDATALVQTKGKHLKDFTAAELAAMETYNRTDTEQCAGLFRILMKKTPIDELRLIDMTIRMLVSSPFEVDSDALTKALAEEKARKRRTLVSLCEAIDGANPQWQELREAGWTDDNITALTGDEVPEEAVRKMLASANKFAEFLDGQGVDVPHKVSPTTGRMTYALAKTDEAFLELQEHPNELVAAAVQARLGTKSTILESRIEAFLTAGEATGGTLPVPLKYYGGHTGRWSGWAYNPQNLPRIDPDKPALSDVLRKSIKAPKGYKVVVSDLSGIELRVNHFLWKVPSSMALYGADPAKADLYKDFASKLYEVLVEEVTKAQRQVGKVSHLGLGFGAGAPTFAKVAKLMAKIVLSEEEAQKIVQAWRAEYQEIVLGWKKCQALFPAIERGVLLSVDPWGLCHTTKDKIVLPSGRYLSYPDMRQVVTDDGKKSWKYGAGRNERFLTGGKADENIVQAIARDVIAGHALEFYKDSKFRPALKVHDELVYVVPEKEAEPALERLNQIMRTPPKWWPELVLWSEGDIANSYGDAK